VERWRKTVGISAGNFCRTLAHTLLRPGFVRLLALALVLLAGCSAAADPSSPPVESEDENYTASDYAEDSLLPYKSGWLDAPKALAGVSQFDRLRGTVHDDSKCSTMVAIAAAIVGGEARFVRLLNETARKREGKREDLDLIDKVRVAVSEKRLTPRHLHELTEVIVRAYGVRYGADDNQIAEMVIASGYDDIHVGSSKPNTLVDHLEANEVIPLGIVAENIPHITLVWKDSRGVVRLYDSDQLNGHVFARGSAGYRQRMDDPQSSWDLKTKYK